MRGCSRLFRASREESSEKPASASPEVVSSPRVGTARDDQPAMMTSRPRLAGQNRVDVAVS
jgi:hypothetical protein